MLTRDQTVLPDTHTSAEIPLSTTRCSKITENTAWDCKWRRQTERVRLCPEAVTPCTQTRTHGRSSCHHRACVGTAGTSSLDAKQPPSISNCFNTTHHNRFTAASAIRELLDFIVQGTPSRCDISNVNIQDNRMSIRLPLAHIFNVT